MRHVEAPQASACPAQSLKVEAITWRTHTCGFALGLTCEEFRVRVISQAQFSGQPEESLMHGYVPIEFPKWVDGVLVQNAAEERAHRAVLEDVALAATVQIEPPPPEQTAERMQLQAARTRIVRPLAAKRVAPGESDEAAFAPEVARPLSLAAARMRLSRKRRHDGLKVVPFE